MLERQDGDVVMIASIAGIDPYPGGSVYCATKAAVQAFARSLRIETLGTGIRVLTFDPGMVDTEFSTVRFHGDKEKATNAYAGLIPLSGEDIADCIAFAVSRPRHMSIDSMLILATAQADAHRFHRQG
jgi:NADP-dependent 3-hydroxy acid dehydrogenase YdfG